MDKLTAITSAEMRALEAKTIASGVVSGLELMERAGRGVVQAVYAEWPELVLGRHVSDGPYFEREEAPRAVILCGPGNNGADGFVIARLLQQDGWCVVVYPYGRDWLFVPSATACTPLSTPLSDADTQALRWRDMGGVSRPGSDMELSGDGRDQLVVDALLGIGQTRSADALLQDFRRAWDASEPRGRPAHLRRVSVDIPTGYDCDQGTQLGDMVFEPDLTVTFHRPKPIHIQMIEAGQKVVVADIGLPRGLAR